MFRKSKIIILTCCTISFPLFFSGELYAFADQSQHEIVSTDVSNAVTKVQTADNHAKLLLAGDDVKTLQLNEVATFFTSFDSHGEQCQINWRYDDFDNSTVGRKELIGDIVLPEGFHFEHSPIQVSQIIYVYNDEEDDFINITSVSIGNDNDIAILIPENTPEEMIPNYFQNLDKQATITTEYGDVLLVDYTIDYEQIAPIGLCMPITLQIPSSFLIDIVAEYNISVCVIENDIIYFESLNAWKDGYLITWLYDAKDIKLLVKVDGEGWAVYKDTNPYGASIIKLDDRIHGDIYGLYIPTHSLEQGRYYQFQLEYDKRVFSNIAGFNLFSEEMNVFFFPDFGGDRPGGDREEVEGPEIEENPKTPLYGNDKESVPPLQIDGNQLEAMTQANPMYTTFLINHTKISLPSSFLKSLSLKKTDNLYIDFKQNGTMSFSLNIYVNGILITNLPKEKILVRIPWSFSSASFIDENGILIPYVLEVGFVTFSLDHFGYFQSTDLSSFTEGTNESNIVNIDNIDNVTLNKGNFHHKLNRPKTVNHSSNTLDPPLIALIIVFISISISTFFWKKKRDS